MIQPAKRFLTGALFLIGGPGSGKGEVVKVVESEFQRLSPQIVRTSGLITKYRPDLLSLLRTGPLAHDADVNDLLSEHMPHSGFVIVDGAPRTKNQFWFMKQDLIDAKTRIFAIIMGTEEEVCMRRMLENRKREDDTRETIKVRFDEHRKHGPAVINLAHNTLRENCFWINGNNDLPFVQRDIREALLAIEESMKTNEKAFLRSIQQEFQAVGAD